MVFRGAKQHESSSPQWKEHHVFLLVSLHEIPLKVSKKTPLPPSLLLSQKKDIVTMTADRSPRPQALPQQQLTPLLIALLQIPPLTLHYHPQHDV
jgi:hypothetical protein